MDTILASGMCRCCSSEGSFKDLSSKYRWMGEDEVYAEMLRECFNVTLLTPEEGPEGGICEVCITQLRNAANFKKQVLSTEQHFQSLLSNNAFKPHVVKVETDALEDDTHLSADDNNPADDFTITEYEVPIKSEPEVKRPKRVSACSSTKQRADGDSSKRDAGKTPKVAILDPTVKRLISKFKFTDVKTESSINWSVTTKQRKKSAAEKYKDDDKRYKHLHNLREILLNTNGTPLKTYDGVGYTCSFCNSSYPELKNLKTHIIKSHSDTEKKTFMDSHPLSEYLVKLDVTGLQCNLCLKNIESIEDMMRHLSNEHGRMLHTDINNHILPFKFEDGYFICVLCQKKTKYMKVMLEHLSMHYANYSCELCGATFVNESKLSGHIGRHKRSANREVHVSVTKRYKCPICGQKFNGYLKRQNHMVEVHSMERIMYKCDACERSYKTASKLSTHKRRHHMLERKHECQVCDKRFFLMGELKQHVLSHTGVKEYQCDVCEKSYGRKSTLTEHQRIHVNERRFKCEHCEQTFVQKCSWKSHMRSRHGIEISFSSKDSS